MVHPCRHRGAPRGVVRGRATGRGWVSAGSAGYFGLPFSGSADVLLGSLVFVDPRGQFRTVLGHDEGHAGAGRVPRGFSSEGLDSFSFSGGGVRPSEDGGVTAVCETEAGQIVQGGTNTRNLFDVTLGDFHIQRGVDFLGAV